MDKQTQKELLETVNVSYDQIAEDFDATRQKKPWPELYKLTESIKDGDAILDVGCGNGRLLGIIQKNIRYVGLDKSEKLVAIAKKNHESRINNCEFVAGDILELGQLPQINFDYVFSIAVLHHLPGKEARINALRQLKNKVSENGKIIITVWNMWPQSKFKKLIFKFIALRLLGKNRMDWGDIVFEWKKNTGEELAKRYYHAFTKYGLKRIITKAGLRIDNIYKDDYNYYVILKK